MIKLASRVERHQQRRAQKSSYHHKSDDGEKEEKREDGKGKGKAVVGKVVDQTQHKKSRDIKCFKCLGLGHIASQCPNKRVMVMKGDKVESEEEEQKGTEAEEEDEAIVEYPIQGDLLMVNQDEAVPNQRTNLFHIQGMVQGKTCLIMLDTGSCTNVASASWVCVMLFSSIIALILFFIIEIS